MKHFGAGTSADGPLGPVWWVPVPSGTHGAREPGAGPVLLPSPAGGTGQRAGQTARGDGCSGRTQYFSFKLFTAAVINHHAFRGLKQHPFILS